LKTYIASEDKGITTSAGHVRKLLGRCIDLGRRYKQTKDDKDYFEALRLLGTATHCLEVSRNRLEISGVILILWMSNL
jgi:hypothetical protein